MTETKSPRSLRIPLPLPSEKLFPNKRSNNRFALTKAKRKARSDSALVTKLMMEKNGITTPFAAATLRAEFTLRTRRDRDNLNAWLKSYQDGLQDAKLVTNDACIIPLSPIIFITKETLGQVGVDLIVTEIERPDNQQVHDVQE